MLLRCVLAWSWLLPSATHRCTTSHTHRTFYVAEEYSTVEPGSMSGRADARRTSALVEGPSSLAFDSVARLSSWSCKARREGDARRSVERRVPTAAAVAVYRPLLKYTCRTGSPVMGCAAPCK